MDTILSKLTVFFEEPFWVGVYERTCGKTYAVCKITFGAEPKDCEVYDYLLENWNRMKFSPSTEATAAAQKHPNPKRMQREIKKQLQSPGIGTKAQQALKLQQEQCKRSRKVRSREMCEAEKEHRFEARQEKRKEKHRGH